MDEKVCSRCGRSKPISEFRAAKSAADGLHPWCRPCDSAYAAERRSKLATRSTRKGMKPPTLTAPTAPAQLGYLAGIIDGEGTITATTDPTGNHTKHYRVAVLMTCERTITWLGQWGGTTWGPFTRQEYAGPRKPQWGWRITGHANVHLLLTALLPYMITKQDTAREALAYIESRSALLDSTRVVDRSSTLRDA